MSDYYEDYQIEKLERDAYDSAMLEAGKDWERERDEHDYLVYLLEKKIASLETEVSELRAYRDGYDPLERLPELTIRGLCSAEYLVVLCDYSEYSKPVFIEACYFSSTKSWLSYEGKGSITKVYRWWPKQNLDRNYAQSGGEQ